MIKDVQVRIQRVAQPKTVLWLWSKPTRIVGKDSVTADIMRMLQVQHPGSQYAPSTPEIGLEKIVKLNPDVILIWGAAKYSESDILNNPQWRSIKAVRNKQVFKAPNWGVWSPQAAPLTLWAATRIYPEHFDSGWSQARIDAFHQKVFGVTIAK
jgi:iron complex transport system substrate-binding protein